MRFGLLVDASCDLPVTALSHPQVAVLPIHARVNDFAWQDDRSPRIRGEFLKAANAIEWKGQIETEPLNADETRKFVIDHLALGFDYVFAITAMRSRSNIFDTLTDVAVRIQPQVAKARADAGVKGPFRLQVCDSSTLFAGHGVIALSLLDEFAKNSVTTHISRLIENQYAKNAYTYFAPAGLKQLYQKAKQRGDKSLSLVSYALGSAFDVKPIVCGTKGTTAPVAKVRHFDEAAARVFENTSRQVQAGLLVPHVVVSDGGNFSQLSQLSAYADLQQACEKNGVQIHIVPMGIGALVNAGVGGVAVGFLAHDHTFE